MGGTLSSREYPPVSETLRKTHESLEPQVEKRKEITAAIYALARECRWEIGSFHWDDYPMSFHWAEVRQGERSFSLLIHEFSPFVALSAALPEYRNLLYFDDPMFVEAAQRIGAPFGILPAGELMQPLSPADRLFVAKCSAQHERNLKYWNPKTVGDVVFNWWD